MKKINNVIAVMFMLGILSFVGCTSDKSKSAIKVKLKPADESGWTLVFTDDFNRDKLGVNWKVASGTWTVKDGFLRGSGIIISARGFPEGKKGGFQRLEFEAATDVQPIIFLKNMPKPTTKVSDLSALLHVQSLEKCRIPMQSNGYLFQFGSYNNKINQIKKARKILVVDKYPAKLITPGTLHKIAAENDHGRLRLFVDGELVLEHQDKQSTISPENNRVGLYFHTDAKISKVKVYVKN